MIDVLRRQKWLVLIVFLSVVGAAVFYVAYTPPEYSATSLLMVDVKPYDPDNALTLDYISGLDNTNVSMHHLVLNNSSTLFQRTAERIGNLTPEERAQIVPDWDETEDLSKTLQRMLQVEVSDGQVQVSDGNVLAVQSAGPSGPGAARLANLFAEEAVAHSRMLSRRKISTSRAFLEQRLVESAATLAESEDNMTQYMRRGGAVALDREAEAAVLNVARVESALAEAQIEYDVLQASLEAREQEIAEIKPQLGRRLASGTSRELEQSLQRLADLELRLEQIYFQNPSLRDAGNTDDRITALRSEIEQWKSRVNQLSEGYVEEVLATGGGNPSDPASGVAYAADLERQMVTDRIELTGLQSRIDALTQQKAQYDARLRTIPAQSMEVAQLERARASSEQLYDYLENRLQEASLAEEAQTGSLHILRAAEVPVVPTSPRPKRIFPLAAFLGIILGVGTGSLRNHLDTRVYTPTDVEDIGISLLGVVPDLRPLIRRQFKGRSNVEIDGRSLGTNLVALLAPKTVAAEAYRHLYVRLRPTNAKSKKRSILVTSPEASVGKSTTAINIAITAAQAQKKTLIIDVDMRKPAVETYLGVTSGITLQDLLLLSTPAEVRAAVIERGATPCPNLFAISIRQPIDNPLVHLVSNRLRALIGILQDEFDFTVLDAPPLLLTPDAALLAPMCDSTIVVVGAGTSDGKALARIIDSLDDAGANIAGVVLNRFDPSNPNFKHTYGYLQHNYGSYYHLSANQ